MQLNFATTTIPTILLWGLAFGVFLVGGLIGYFNMNIDARKKQDSADQKIETARAEADRRIAEAQKKLEEAKALAAMSPNAEARSFNEPSLLRLKSDDNFRVEIEMDGSPLTAPLSVERRKRLIELIGHFRPWLEGGTDLQATSKPTAAPPSTLAAASVPQVSPQVKPVPASLTFTPQKPKMDAETEFKLLSMVKQIDVVLQRQIAGTPLEAMNIHLNDKLQGGLEVQIGARNFESIDDVPDENVKAAIRSAIAEWEQKYIPGTS